MGKQRPPSNVSTDTKRPAGPENSRMPEFKDYYKILQVDPSADPEIIVVAYRRLAMKYHPDTNGAPDAGRLMQDINEAYRILSDPDSRARYDAERAWHRERHAAAYGGNARPASPAQAPAAPDRRARPEQGDGWSGEGDLDPDSATWRTLQRDQPTGRPYWPQWGIRPGVLVAIICIALAVGFLLLNLLTPFRGFLFIFVSPSLIALAIDLLRRK
jgi:curved DNA-binding protein CbpA